MPVTTILLRITPRPKLTDADYAIVGDQTAPGLPNNRALPGECRNSNQPGSIN